MEVNDNLSIRGILETDELAKEHPELIDKLVAVFEYTQYLLDDDSYLTKTMNFNANGKQKLDERILELFLQVVEENA